MGLKYFFKIFLQSENDIPVFRHSGVPAFRCSGIPVFRHSGVPAFWCSGIPVFRHSFFYYMPSHSIDVIAEGFCGWKYSSVNFIHLLDLTIGAVAKSTSSCMKPMAAILALQIFWFQDWLIHFKRILYPIQS
jgi:hypothetical protein